MSQFFKRSNTIHVHNQTRQDILAIETNWDTRDCWFRLDCTIVGMVVVDAWRGLKYKNIIPSTMSIRKFTNQLCKTLLVKLDLPSKTASASPSASGRPTESHTLEPLNDDGRTGAGVPGRKKKKRKQQACVWCSRHDHKKMKSSYQCSECKVVLCFSKERQCWQNHIDHGVPEYGAWKRNSEHHELDCDVCIRQRIDQTKRQNTTKKRSER